MRVPLAEGVTATPCIFNNFRTIALQPHGKSSMEAGLQSRTAGIVDRLITPRPFPYPVRLVRPTRTLRSSSPPFAEFEKRVEVSQRRFRCSPRLERPFL